MKVKVCDKCQEKKQVYKAYDKYFCKKCKRSIKKIQLGVMKKHPEITGNAEKITEKVREKMLEAENV